MKLTFGTGGLRAVMGEAEDQMNLQTIREATLGVAAYAKQICKEGMPKVAIAYDSRRNSEEFAREAARILALQGCEPFIYPKLAPTPSLSFAVRYLRCHLGICITASHNPSEYNGYKVYGSDGGQITEAAALEISRCIQQEAQRETGQQKALTEAQGQEQKQVKYSLDPDLDFQTLRELGLIHWIQEEVQKAFLKEIYKCRTRKQLTGGLKVVYTPLHGAGLSYVVSILQHMGVKELQVVPEQSKPDGAFPTCPYPNPENPEAMKLGLLWCQKLDADLLLATDPDSDRVGVAARRDSGYAVLSGNQVGVLLLDYLLAHKKCADRPVLMKTIVSTVMAEKIAERHGAEVINTLTGFKYIGEQMTRLEEMGQADRYLFGFEESCGYLVGTYVRDKDAVGACMLICEMADAYKAQGKTLWQRMEELYAEYGRYETSQQTYQLSKAGCAEKMNRIRTGLKTNPEMKFQGVKVVRYEDYKEGIHGLPPADVLELWLEDGGKAVIRPSGTEPKLKVYLEKAANLCI